MQTLGIDQMQAIHRPNKALQILVFKHSIKQLQHIGCLEHDADDDGMIREDKALFPEVYDEGC